MNMLSIGLTLALLSAACSRPADDATVRESGERGDRGSRVADAEAAPDLGARIDVAADAPLVAFLGDSLAAGLHLPPERAFPAAAQRLLVQSGHPFRLLNAGVSGDTSAGGLSRVDWVLAQKPAVLVVELGGNDGLRGQPVASIESNLRAIVTRATDAGVRVLLLGIQMPPSYGAAYCEAFAALYPRIASELAIEYEPRFLDGVGGVPEMVLEDGLHPTAAGQERLAANVVPALKRVLASLPAPVR